MSDFNTAIKDWLVKCPEIQADKLFFNFLNTSDGCRSLVTVSEEISEDVVGNKLGKYTFAIVAFEAMAGMALMYNADDISIAADFAKVNDWIREQDDIHNYPELDKGIVVDEIAVLPNPVFNGAANSEGVIMAKYTTQVTINYVKFI